MKYLIVYCVMFCAALAAATVLALHDHPIVAALCLLAGCTGFAFKEGEK